MKKVLMASIGAAALFMACSGDDDGASSLSTNVDNRRVANTDSVLVKDGYFTDSRDGNKYKVVEINGDYWFAENLRYLDSAKMENLKGNVWCYDDKPENCEKYGALYSWSAAMDVEPMYNSEEAVLLDDIEFDICPDGWTIPDHAQWMDLISYAGTFGLYEDNGTALKSIKGWDEVDTVPNGTNRFGFNILAAGRYNSEGGFLPDGKNAYFWTRSEYSGNIASGFSLRSSSKFADYGQYYKDHGMSVRCIAKNSDMVKLEGKLDSSYIAEIPHEYGSVTVGDKEYKTIYFSGRTWMAENLNYEFGDSWCYDDESSSCDEFGRLYNWETAQKVCPEGWRLPTSSDYEKFIGTHFDKRYLRSFDGWKKDGGLNFWGFNALAAGAYNEENATFFDKKLSAYFWTSDEDIVDPGMAYALFISYSDDDEVKAYEKKQAYSVRCVKD